MSNPFVRSALRFASLTGLALLMLGNAQATDLSGPWQTAQDPIATLWRRVVTGQEKLDTSTDQAFLRSLLQKLRVPVASQVLVFSKTSLQKTLITPSHPRSLYYNEDCYIGWPPGGDIELIGVDPELGPQFYLIRRPFGNAVHGALASDQSCVTCHAGSSLQALSVQTSASGYPLAEGDRFTTTFESPLSERWGGWYVTGQHGEDFHMGNLITPSMAKSAAPDRRKGVNLETLDKLLPTGSYLTNTSDIVALMVLEHQYVVENTLSEVGQATRRVLARQQLPGFSENKENLDRILHKYARRIVSLLLFSGEYELKQPITGNAAFQESFRSDRRQASDGTSLKDFNLHTHLFEHRCSYMIYSASFAHLPEPLKQAVYAQLGDVLQGKNSSPEFAHLESSERAQIQKLLMETLPEVKAAWQNSPTPPSS